MHKVYMHIKELLTITWETLRSKANHSSSQFSIFAKFALKFPMSNLKTLYPQPN